jgi:Na+/H+-dicarboxylate symporter
MSHHPWSIGFHVLAHFYNLSALFLVSILMGASRYMNLDKRKRGLGQRFRQTQNYTEIFASVITKYIPLSSFSYQYWMPWIMQSLTRLGQYQSSIIVISSITYIYTFIIYQLFSFSAIYWLALQDRQYMAIQFTLQKLASIDTNKWFWP